MSYADNLKNPSQSEPTVLAAKILGIIKTLLTTLQKSHDFNAREAIINTVMFILNVISEPLHD